ncbi:hypothetical protein D3C72_793380 [compost metagenome]
MARRLRLSLNHFALFAQQFVFFCDHGQRRAVVLFIALFIAEQCAPARFRQKTRFGDELTFGDLQLNHAFAEHRVRAKLHQILARHEVIHLRFVLAQIDVAGARRRDNRVVRVDFFIIPAAVARFRVHGGLREQVRGVNADGIQHRMSPGKMLFRQVAAV